MRTRFLEIEEKMSRLDSLRYEIKMICYESGWDSLWSSLVLSRSCLLQMFPPRRVQSIYLDTYSDKALYDNLDGISYREKVRLRWYGLAFDSVDGTLECKVRENVLGWKHTVSLAEPVRIEGINRCDFINDLLRQVPPAWAEKISRGLEPVQWISYLREYYMTVNGKLRITIDRDLKAFNQRHRFVLSCRYPSPMPEVIIVEAKCSPEDHGEVRAFLESFPLFVDKCSKFVMASDPQEGPSISVLGI